jgi:iron(III) transport system substrate-binding protein
MLHGLAWPVTRLVTGLRGSSPTHLLFWVSRGCLLLFLLVFAQSGCKPRGPEPVVVYTSLDEPYARPVLEAFSRETNVPCLPVYDTEASKSRGLAQRILAERSRPQADVFWSSEVMQMLLLQKEGVLEPYRSPSADGIPARYRDPGGHWTAFAARFRVLVYNKKRVREPPETLAELAEGRWRGQVAMARPLFGTTMTEAAALFQVWGADRARDYYHRRKENGTKLVDGNSAAAEWTARGDVLIGQTDTDDAYIRVERGRPLGIVFPDQGGAGALLIPNTAGLIKGSPHPDQGQRFLDFLLRPETELLLAGLPSRQLPLHESLQSKLPEQVRPLARVKPMKVDYGRLRERYEEVESFLRELFQ